MTRGCIPRHAAISATGVLLRLAPVLLPREEGTFQRPSYRKWLTPRPKPALDWLICTEAEPFTCEGGLEPGPDPAFGVSLTPPSLRKGEKSIATNTLTRPRGRVFLFNLDEV